MPSHERPRALLLTVGTGDNKRLEETLYVPLLKSIDTEPWARITLLPSRSTIVHADEIKSRRPALPIDVRPLSDEGVENDPDRCYFHFEQEISRLQRDEFVSTDIVVDFTRGTKAMSAALVLAASRHDVAALRYIAGDRDLRGMVVPGTEDIVALSPAIATAQKRLDTALRLAEHGNFAGALEVLQEDGVAAWPAGLAEAARAVRPALGFFAAWDRLDYRTAAAVDLACAAPLPEWQSLWPTTAARAWVAGLASIPPASDAAAMAARLRLLACDLLANGERRIRDRHYEDAVLRAYRVLELIGQIRLFDHGLDSGRLPSDHPAVRKLSAKLERNRSTGLGVRPDGSLTAAREQVARLLKVLGDPLASRLLGFDRQPTLPRVSARNDSVLIHGFQAIGPDDDALLRALYRGLEKLLIMDAGDAAQTALTTARQAGFSISLVAAL